MGATYSSCTPSRTSSILFFFFNDTATTEIYTLSLHDALPISLLAVAQALPRSPADLAPVPQLPATLARRHGPALLESVGRALALPETELPRVERSARRPKDAALESRIERLKAARNRVAAELGLDPGVLCGRSTLEAVARTIPTPNDRAGLSRGAELRRWQIEGLGTALLAALA